MLLPDGKQGLFEIEELRKVELRWPDGVSSQDVIDLFQSRGVKLSEATFRKYVQMGLLPNSRRRVGTKGKHRGSRGVYPTSVARRINLIKRLMQEGLTLEEIRDSFVSIQNDIEKVSDAFDCLFSSMEVRMENLQDEGCKIEPVEQDIAKTRQGAKALLRQVERIGSQLAVVSPVSIQE
jgi:DNA-binding transcriptional MerR regulator